MTEYEWIRNIVEVCEAVQVKRGSDKDFYNNGNVSFALTKKSLPTKFEVKLMG